MSFAGDPLELNSLWQAGRFSKGTGFGLLRLTSGAFDRIAIPGQKSDLVRIAKKPFFIGAKKLGLWGIYLEEEQHKYPKPWSHDGTCKGESMTYVCLWKMWKISFCRWKIKGPQLVDPIRILVQLILIN